MRQSVSVPVTIVLLLVATAGTPAVAQQGPDIAIIGIDAVTNYGAVAGVRGYAAGVVACNIGDRPAAWCDEAGGCGQGTTSADHPVLAQNLYRIANGRLEQIGASWLAHGFMAGNSTRADCGAGICALPPLGGNQLGVGCSHASAGPANGSRPLGRRSEVDPAIGAFAFPFDAGGATGAAWNQRLAVAESDLDPAINPGARYLIEAHYVAADDALGGNASNNASHREVTVSGAAFNLLPSAPTVPQRTAIEGWQAIDATVSLVRVDVPGPGVQRFLVARRVDAKVAGALWRYAYAVHNFNVSRAADRLSIVFDRPTIFSSTGFRDVDAHSGEPYDTTDWAAATQSATISWEAPAFPAAPQNANAIRWGTSYSFWFEADQPPERIAEQSIRLFVTGVPDRIVFDFDRVFGDGFEDP